MRRTGNRRAWVAALLAAGLSVFASACSQAPAATRQAAKQMPAAYRDVARSALGNGAKVLLYGDLAHNGHIQLLVANRFPEPNGKAAPGLYVSRAAILQRQGNEWREVFLADQQLKNPEGFLGRTPHSSVSAWRLRYEKEPAGLAMYFTPLRQAAKDQPPTIEVRWNPKVERYQSLGPKFEHFLAEMPTLGPIPEFRMTQ